MIVANILIAETLTADVTGPLPFYAVSLFLLQGVSLKELLFHFHPYILKETFQFSEDGDVVYETGLS